MKTIRSNIAYGLCVYTLHPILLRGQYPPMKNSSENSPRVLLSGASGFIGTALSRALVAHGLQPVHLQRKDHASDASHVHWNPYARSSPIVASADLMRLEDSSVAIHLAGDNVAEGRWTSEKKKRMWESRVTTTTALSQLLAGLNSPPSLLICASAIGYYGNRGNQVLTEASPAGLGYLSGLCVAWEQAADVARQRGLRVVHLRFGVVLGPGGGALAKMAPLFRLGLGGRLGGGQQWVSWIFLNDVLQAILHICAHPNVTGAVNLVSPHPVTNLELTKTLGQALHRPTLMPAPAFALRAVLGEMADATLLASARVLPTELTNSGYIFQHPTLRSALDAAFQSSPPALLG